MRKRFVYAIAIPAIAYVIQRLLWPFIPPSPHLLFYPAVFLAAWLGGARAGFGATVLSTILIAYAFLPPTGIAVEDPGDLLDLGIFAGVALGISTIMGTLRGALERERAAAAEAERLRKATDDTWSMIAHDLRSPLNVINLGSAELERRLHDDGGAERIVGMIRRSSDRARDLIQDALDAMRLEGGALRIDCARQDAGALCGRAVDAIEPLAQKKHVEVRCTVEGGCTVDCDARRMQQVLGNLLGNAVKYTPQGGHIDLTVTREGEGTHFVIQDTGPGIPEAAREAIFAKHWTRGGDGAGLGLWIARTIVEAHAARLTLAHADGRGAKFEFTVPASSPASATDTRGEATAPSRD